MKIWSPHTSNKQFRRISKFGTSRMAKWFRGRRLARNIATERKGIMLAFTKKYPFSFRNDNGHKGTF